LLAKKNDAFHLSCGTFPSDGAPVDLLDLGAHLPEESWLDEDRLLLAGTGMIDLAAGAKITFEPSTDAARLHALGPRYVVVEEPPKLLDLEARTRITLGKANESPFLVNDNGVSPVAAIHNRLWVTRSEDRNGGLPALFELHVGR